MTYRNNKGGFTLIELLVVIAIIGILSSVVLASLTSAREKAKLAALSQEQRQAELFLEITYEENEGYPYGDADWYCISDPAPSTPDCLHHGEAVTPNITEAGGGTITKSLQDGRLANLAAIAPRFKNSFTVGPVGDLNRGIIYIPCDDPVTNSVGLEVCVPGSTPNESTDAVIIAPRASGGSFIVGYTIVGTSIEGTYGDGGTI
jgi:prepilin-type N-terminal cleavage/methylation domain-containing protein